MADQDQSVMAQYEKPNYVPPPPVDSEFPLIDSDPHIKRVLTYARPVDWAAGAVFAAIGPAWMIINERFAPSYASKGGFPKIMRLTVISSLMAGALLTIQRSTMRFYGCRENSREIQMDMREMVDKVKKGEPLYGVSELTPYMQGVAARNSRYGAFFYHVIPWFNFVNHNQHGTDPAKYYQQAERELEAERLAQQ